MSLEFAFRGELTFADPTTMDAVVAGAIASMPADERWLGNPFLREGARLSIHHTGSAPASMCIAATDAFRRIASRADAGFVDLAVEHDTVERVHAKGRVEHFAPRTPEWRTLWEIPAPLDPEPLPSATEVSHDTLPSLLRHALVTTGRSRRIRVADVGAFESRASAIGISFRRHARPDPDELSFDEWLARSTGRDPTWCHEACERWAAPIADALKAQRSTSIPGIGAFSWRTKVARETRNPQTGAMVDVPARAVLVFAPAPELLAALRR